MVYLRCQIDEYFTETLVVKEMLRGELVLYAIFQPCMVIYGGQFPQVEEQIVLVSEPATFR